MTRKKQSRSLLVRRSFASSREEVFAAFTSAEALKQWWVPFDGVTVVDAQVDLRIGGLWLDGFAEMTPQELDLLAAVLPICERATLAFCIDTEARDPTSWLSGWSAVHQT